MRDGCFDSHVPLLVMFERPNLLVKKRPDYTSLLDSERDGPSRRRPLRGRHGDDPQLVLALVERRPGGAATGDPELVAPRQHVAQTREEPDPHAARVPERDVEPLERLHLVAAGRVRDLPCLERQDRGLLVGGLEAGQRERDAAEEVAARRAEGDRPRHAERLVALRPDADRAFRRSGAHRRAGDRRPKRELARGAARSSAAGPARTAAAALEPLTVP